MDKVLLKLKKVSIALPAENLPQDGQRIITCLVDSVDSKKQIVLELEPVCENVSETKELQSPKYPWVKDMNQQYQKVMSTIITLAVAALILPIFFLRDLLSIPRTDKIIEHLSSPSFLKIGISYWSWLFLGLSIFCAILFFYVSANRIKEAWGATVKRLFWIKIGGERTIQVWLYIFYNASVFFFLFGIIFFVLFAITNYSKGN